MKKLAKIKQKPILPLDIKLPERELLENGTMFVVLKTLSEFEEFLNNNKDRFEFCCHSTGIEPVFLNYDDWVFGNSGSAIVHTVMRWGKSNIGCEYYDMAISDPQFFEFIKRDRASYRKSQIEKGEWTENDEALHVKQCARDSNESTRGWWRFKDLPNSYDPSDWFSGNDYEEIFDRNIPIAEVARILHEQTFHEWMNSSNFDVKIRPINSLSEYIEYWREDENSEEIKT